MDNSVETTTTPPNWFAVMAFRAAAVGVPLLVGYVTLIAFDAVKWAVAAIVVTGGASLAVNIAMRGAVGAFGAYHQMRRDAIETSILATRAGVMQEQAALVIAGRAMVAHDGALQFVATDPPPQLTAPQELRLEVTSNNGRRMQYFDLPPGVDHDALLQFADGWRVQGLAQSAWTGRGKPFSRAGYDALLSALHDAGIVEWVNDSAPAQGRRVSPAGAETLDALLV